MDVHDALRTRRTAHLWKPTPVPDAVIHRALEAAHHAPNHKLTWPWRFTLVGPQTRARVADVAVALKRASKGPLSDEAVAAIRAKLVAPGAAIAVSRVHADDPFRAREDYAAVACAIQNIQLSAHADGFAAKWSTGGFTRDARVYDALGIDADAETIEGFVFVGEPRVVPEIRRPPVAQVVRRLP